MVLIEKSPKPSEISPFTFELIFILRVKIDFREKKCKIFGKKNGKNFGKKNCKKLKKMM